MKFLRAHSLLLGAFWLAGCSDGSRTITVRTVPDDATVKVDDENKGSAPVTTKLKFAPGQTHVIGAVRYGFGEQRVTVDENYPLNEVQLILPSRSKRVTFHVEPVPAKLLLDGKPLHGGAAVKEDVETLNFPYEKDHSITHTITAERIGYQGQTKILRYDDPEARCVLTLAPMSKQLHIETDPPGAEVFIGKVSYGPSPVNTEYAVPVDVKTNAWVEQEIRAEKAGYLPSDEVPLSWDEGRQDYRVELHVRTKTVKIVTKPPGAKITLDGKECQTGADGVTIAPLTFPPINDQGDLKSYVGMADPSTPDAVPTKFDVGWDEGKEDYSVKLEPGKLRRVILHRPQFVQDNNGWRVADDPLTISAPADTTGPVTGAPTLVTTVDQNQSLEMIATSPDGSQIAFAVLWGGTHGELRSEIRTVHPDGAGGPAKSRTNDLGGTVYLTPSYSPDGARLLFSSDRGGKGLAIWSVPTDGASVEPVQVSPGDGVEFWPSLDSRPRPRLFYEAMTDGQAMPRLRMVPFHAEPADAAAPTELVQPGLQPHISPEADRVVFTQVDPSTGKRDLMIVPDTGGAARNLTSSSTSDDFDPAWSRDAGKIAFVSDRPLPGHKDRKPGTYHIWVLNVDHPEAATPVTSSDCWDDSPAWDASGKVLYFRSDRGGKWGIWKVELGEKRKQ